MEGFVLSDERIGEIRKRLESTTKAPWKWENGRLKRVVEDESALDNYYGVYNVLSAPCAHPVVGSNPDKLFIENAPDDVRYLLNVIDDLAKDNRNLRTELQRALKTLYDASLESGTHQNGL